MKQPGTSKRGKQASVQVAIAAGAAQPVVKVEGTSLSEASASAERAAKVAAEAKYLDAPQPERAVVRIVGIGASAGGLEALERFFDAMPVDSGLAFAVVQHLSPDFRSMMDELLARHSRMTIRHAVEGTEVEPNTVYLNPPRQNLIIENGRLYLRQPNPRDQPNHPIDAFFHSLASDRGSHAIGVILSGTGSDGTKGAKSILAGGGVVLVQEPASAKFENMPRSAIEKGVASGIALPEEIPALIGRVLRGETPAMLVPELEDSLDPETEILRLLEKRFGANFGYYKKTTVGRRFNRRAALNGMQDLANYVAMLRREPAELERLYADLLIGVTAFFRDKPAFDTLASTIVPQLAEKMTESNQLRIWVPGCASGEEAYSIAILFSEYARKQDLPLNIKIFATDLHQGSLEKAGAGIYDAKSLSEMPTDVRDRYFDDTGRNFQAKSTLRRLIVCSPQNLIKDPPFTRLDLISCRNMLIYLDDVAQRKVLGLFHFALVQDGILFLGPSETVADLVDEFDPVDARWRIFRKIRNIQLVGSTRMLPTLPQGDSQGLGAQYLQRQPRPFNSASRAGATVRTDRRYLLQAYDAVLARYAPPSLLTTRSGELVHVFGDAQKFLRLKTGLFSARVADVVIEPLKLAVSACIDSVRISHVAPVVREISYRNELGQVLTVQVQATKLADAGVEPDPDYVLVTLTERVREAQPLAASGGRRVQFVDQVEHLDERAALQGRLEDLERNLHFTEESLQTTIEELETSNEELQSTNEEMMSANEELQSTNEELHAVNEELYSVSAEHRRKIDELTALTNDMDHLLRCTDVGTIFLDQELRIRRFTPAVARAFNLLERDIGRPIEHITARFAYAELAHDVAMVASTNEIIEHTVNVDDLNLLLRIFPFQVGDRTRGIVISLMDVSRLKHAERALETRNQELARLNASLEQFTYIVSHDLRAPLRTILNSAKWIEEDLGASANEDIRGHCHRLMAYSKRLTDMLTDLMEYSKLGHGDSAVEIVDFPAIVAIARQTLDGDERLLLSWTGEPVPFACRRAPLQLVIQNLLDNALKYNDKEQVSVCVAMEDLGTHMRFKFSDDGPGIPKRHHDKIFLPFRKLEHATDKPGTGMGLALVKKAIEDNGGVVEVLSAPDERPGTTFRFTWAKHEKRGDERRQNA
jgi:two-component system, chemotaxis family, CheB/CheR fusion protein